MPWVLFFLFFAHSLAIATPLSLSERILFQKAIENVYWQHRTWNNPMPKPPLSAGLSADVIQIRVEDTLRKSNALAIYWQRPVTSDQLLAETHRMIAQTRDPQMLRELFAALGNDPIAIAECLARPLLVDRLIRTWYASDDRIHGAVREQAKSDLARFGSVDQMSKMSGLYQEITWRNSTNNVEDIGLSPQEWEDMAKKYSTYKIDGLTQLQEDPSRFFVEAVLSRDSQTIRVASVSWSKTPFDQWWASFRQEFPSTIQEPEFQYSLPILADSQCLPGTWNALPAGPNGTLAHTAVWTGSEMLIWGGFKRQPGFRYDPATDTWTPMTTVGQPDQSALHSAVWTGHKMIVWGGEDVLTGSNTNSGGIYDPLTDTWQLTSTSNAPAPRFWHSAVWTGKEMIVWGGQQNDGVNNTGGRYNPKTNTWILTSTSGAPSPRTFHSAVWTGRQMIVWGGNDDSQVFNTGGLYNPKKDVWQATSTVDVPLARTSHATAWTGASMIVWGGSLTLPAPDPRSGANAGDDTELTNSGAIYNPKFNLWEALPTTDAPSARDLATAVWTGSEMIVWGGQGAEDYPVTGGRYNPTTHTWLATTENGAPTGRTLQTAVWTGSEMIIWGGLAGFFPPPGTGGRYNPTTDSWAPTNTYNTPTARFGHTAVWTGAEMLVWGGFNSPYSNPGAKYDPATNTWTPTSIVNAPESRSQHMTVWTGSEMIIWGGVMVFPLNGYTITGYRYSPTTDSWIQIALDANTPTARVAESAVWIGSEMIVWGGHYFDSFFQDGARYNPSSDSWSPVSLTGAPDSRIWHTAIWTGSEMIVWGGYRPYDGQLNSGGRYDPLSDSWTATSVDANTPEAREFHTAIWSGSEMIVWGGWTDQAEGVNTGGRYNPLSDAWAATSTDGAPDPRYAHTAVWNGSQMMIWGGKLVSGDSTNTGGSCDPAADSWNPITLDNAPWERQNHTAIWTGQQMIVWGGFSQQFSATNTGGSYCVNP